LGVSIRGGTIGGDGAITRLLACAAGKGQHKLTRVINNNKRANMVFFPKFDSIDRKFRYRKTSQAKILVRKCD
jgi:hypothetical protein